MAHSLQLTSVSRAAALISASLGGLAVAPPPHPPRESMTRCVSAWRCCGERNLAVAGEQGSVKIQTERSMGRMPSMMKLKVLREREREREKVFCLLVLSLRGFFLSLSFLLLDKKKWKKKRNSQPAPGLEARPRPHREDRRGQGPADDGGDERRRVDIGVRGADLFFF